MLGILSLALLGAAAAPHTCDSLMTLRLPQTTVTSVAVIPAGPFAQPGAGRGRQGAAPEAVDPIPEHCRVKMVLKPTSDSNPRYAKYKGSGDLKDAKNWACTAP